MNGVVWCRGCSFSFGEGLQYFSNLPSVVIPKIHEFDYFELRHSQYRFIQNNRYSKLLADKLGTIDVNASGNGGTNTGGGGGGSRSATSDSWNGGNGGSGIVIVRYRI